MKTRYLNTINKPVRILLAKERSDDEDLLVRQLRKSHMEGHVKIIPDGKQVWNFLAVEGSDINLIAIFLDLHLPSLSGLKLLCRIKSHPQLCNIPVIVVTSTNKTTELEDCVFVWELTVSSQNRSLLPHSPRPLPIPSTMSRLGRFHDRNKSNLAFVQTIDL